MEDREISRSSGPDLIIKFETCIALRVVTSTKPSIRRVEDRQQTAAQVSNNHKESSKEV